MNLLSKSLETREMWSSWSGLVRNPMILNCLPRGAQKSKSQMSLSMRMRTWKRGCLSCWNQWMARKPRLSKRRRICCFYQVAKKSMTMREGKNTIMTTIPMSGFLRREPLKWWKRFVINWWNSTQIKRLALQLMRMPILPSWKNWMIAIRRAYMQQNRKILSLNTQLSVIWPWTMAWIKSLSQVCHQIVNRLRLAWVNWQSTSRRTTSRSSTLKKMLLNPYRKPCLLKPVWI